MYEGPGNLPGFGCVIINEERSSREGQAYMSAGTRPATAASATPVDAAGFDAFYVATSRRVLRVMVAVTADLASAQECTQEAYVRAWARWPEVSRLEEPAAWVHTVARNLAVSRWRHVRAGIRAVARTGAPVEVRPPNEDHVAVVTALRRLSPALRETLALHYLADLSIEEIAVMTKTPTGTIKARLHRGRRQLADLLRPEDPAPAALHSARTSPRPAGVPEGGQHG